MSYLSSSSLICNLNLLLSYYKFLGVLINVLFKFIFTYLQS